MSIESEAVSPAAGAAPSRRGPMTGHRRQAAAALNAPQASRRALVILAAIPALGTLDVVFGLLQIVWFAWLGISMLRTSADTNIPSQVAAALAVR